MDPPEDRHEEHSSTNHVDVVSWIQDICDLPPASSESQKSRHFQAGLDSDDQPSSSYQLPIGVASADILVNFDD